MKNFSFIRILFFITLLFSSSFSITQAASDGIPVNLRVGSCNNNGICETHDEDFFSCPADCTPVIIPPTGGGSSGSLVNVFKDLTVEVSYNSATIKWKSTIPTMSSLKWGTSQEYKDGVLRNINFLLDHKVVINNLKDGTLYYFNIQAENLLGGTNSLENQYFITLSLPDITPPGNPTNVRAISNISGITVSWENPTDEDFDYIRVMRNEDRFYGSPFLGHLVYEGNGTYFTDGNVVVNHKYYYSLFSRDRTGNYSSGSLIDIIHNPFGLDTWGNILTQVQKVKPLENIYKVFQGTSVHDFNIGSIILLRSDEIVNVKTNYSPRTHNDDMWIEIIDKDNVTSKYLFGRAKDKDGFINVSIPPFVEGGYYSVNIYRYYNKTSEIMNQGAFLINKLSNKTSNNYFWYIVWIILFILFILFIIFWLFWIIYKKRKKDRKEKERDSEKI